MVVSVAQHRLQTKEKGIHQAHAFEFPDEANRLANTNRDPSALPLFVDALVLQLDTGDIFRVTNAVTPTYVIFGGDITLAALAVSAVAKDMGGGDVINLARMDFIPQSGAPNLEGRVFYDDNDKALSLKTDIAGSTQSVGQEFWVRVINRSGAPIPDGSVVRVTGFDVASGRVTVVLAQADTEINADELGLATNTMADNAEGFVTVLGFINDIDTSAFSAGDKLFLSPTTPGGLTTTKPTISIPVGFATLIDASTGQILVTIDRIMTDAPIFAVLSSALDQVPSTTDPTVMTFEVQDGLEGLTHSTTVNPGEVTIQIAGTYFMMPQPQIGKLSGGTALDFDMFFQIDRGSGFVDEPNSNVKETIKDSDRTDVLVLALDLKLDAGDKIRVLQKVSSTAGGLGIRGAAAVVGPPTVPATPSIIFTMHRSGGF